MGIIVEYYNKEDIDSFQNDLKQFNISVTENEMNSFLKYYELLLEWNSFMNLTSITDLKDVFKKHFVDSISLVKAVPDLSKISYSLIDVGSGAGFPGIPLKILFPDLKITLLDSLNKRVRFLSEVSEQLNLKNIIIVHGRAEEYAREKNIRENFDLCVSRAVSNLATLSEYCIPFIKKGGYFISYKADQVGDELEASKKAVNVLGGKIINQISFQLPDSDIGRNLIVIKKIKDTPFKYPRKSGLPSKEPIVKK